MYSHTCLRTIRQLLCFQSGPGMSEIRITHRRIKIKHGKNLCAFRLFGIYK
ncbi:hypothetical protein ANACOL_01102 [Anaerotruncus colihominis DSM 17241]|uniref:Uncharacterized protein n=1 Tax=Anaerotruncus colihominis DSM 17241 TaxID=445972 RepID=B0P8L3_9FIRM|nr:hypothetical protein ANACOL_01102 [Anaerotruncus colihominis DSM 17241]